MSNHTLYHAQILINEYALRRKRSPAYSMRAFARDLDTHPSTISQTIRGKRGLPLATAQKICDLLGLGPEDRTLFLESTQGINRLDQIKIDRLDNRTILSEKHSKVYSEWEYFVVYALFDLEGFTVNAVNVHEKLRISKERAQEVIDNLLDCGLVVLKDGILKPNTGPVRTTEDIPSSALRKGHKEALFIASEKLETVPVELRDYSRMTLALDKNNLSEAKSLIREFRRKITKLCSFGPKNDVYQLGIQLYPMTSVDPQ